MRQVTVNDCFDRIEKSQEKREANKRINVMISQIVAVNSHGHPKNLDRACLITANQLVDKLGRRGLIYMDEWCKAKGITFAGSIAVSA